MFTMIIPGVQYEEHMMFTAARQAMPLADAMPSSQQRLSRQELPREPVLRMIRYDGGMILLRRVVRTCAADPRPSTCDKIHYHINTRPIIQQSTDRLRTSSFKSKTRIYTEEYSYSSSTLDLVLLIAVLLRCIYTVGEVL